MSIDLEKIKKLPDTPGVYFFLGKNKKILYIGKATSLRNRVKSYVSKDIAVTRSELIAQMIREAVTIDFKQTDSVLEALILEADLIKKFKPEGNTREKDDKSFNCVVITQEDFPVIKLVRKKDIDAKNMQTGEEKLKAIYGPFPESVSIREGLKIIRKIFPFRDEKCRILSKPKPCFNYQIGLCPGTCLGKISKKEYAVVVRNIQLFFQGKKGRLVSILKKEMENAILDERFEDAAEKRNQIHALNHIRDISLIRRELVQDSRVGPVAFRIEAYDIAHMGGKNMVGVMVVMENGEFNKSEYRKFIIRGFSSSNDTGALQEVLRRRMRHAEWQKADVIVIDGGQAQINAAHKTLTGIFEGILISVVKDDRHQARDLIGDTTIVNTYKKDIIKLNAEAHRYALSFHKTLRNKAFLPEGV